MVINWHGFGRSAGDIVWSFHGGLHLVWDSYAAYAPLPREWQAWMASKLSEQEVSAHAPKDDARTNGDDR